MTQIIFVTCSFCSCTFRLTRGLADPLDDGPTRTTINETVIETSLPALHAYSPRGFVISGKRVFGPVAILPTCYMQWKVSLNGEEWQSPVRQNVASTYTAWLCLSILQNSSCSLQVHLSVERRKEEWERERENRTKDRFYKKHKDKVVSLAVACVRVCSSEEHKHTKRNIWHTKLKYENSTVPLFFLFLALSCELLCKHSKPKLLYSRKFSSGI